MSKHSNVKRGNIINKMDFLKLIHRENEKEYVKFGNPLASLEGNSRKEIGLFMNDDGAVGRKMGLLLLFVVLENPRRSDSQFPPFFKKKVKGGEGQKVQQIGK